MRGYTQGVQGGIYTRKGIPRVYRVCTTVGISQGVQGVYHGGYTSGCDREAGIPRGVTGRRVYPGV